MVDLFLKLKMINLKLRDYLRIKQLFKQINLANQLANCLFSNVMITTLKNSNRSI